jgi:methyl-accepting chemotaxis protein
VGEISSAAMEQSNGIGQVNQAVSQMDQVTQQNAALVEESASAAQSLSAQAQKLAEVVAIFKIDGAGASAMVLVAAAPVAHRRPGQPGH